jgi:hypothetical protein
MGASSSLAVTFHHRATKPVHPARGKYFDLAAFGICTHSVARDFIHRLKNLFCGAHLDSLAVILPSGIGCQSSPSPSGILL